MIPNIIISFLVIESIARRIANAFPIKSAILNGAFGSSLGYTFNSIIDCVEDKKCRDKILDDVKRFPGKTWDGFMDWVGAIDPVIFFNY